MLGVMLDASMLRFVRPGLAARLHTIYHVSMKRPGQFRKKPITIEAVEWDGQWGTAAFLTCAFSIDDDTKSLFIPTLEGEMEARVGDWIIKGVQGEFYPCKPDIFAATYAADMTPTNDKGDQ